MCYYYIVLCATFSDLIIYMLNVMSWVHHLHRWLTVQHLWHQPKNMAEFYMIMVHVYLCMLHSPLHVLILRLCSKLVDSHFGYQTLLHSEFFLRDHEQSSIQDIWKCKYICIELWGLQCCIKICVLKLPGSSGFITQYDSTVYIGIDMVYPHWKQYIRILFIFTFNLKHF